MRFAQSPPHVPELVQALVDCPGDIRVRRIPDVTRPGTANRHGLESIFTITRRLVETKRAQMEIARLVSTGALPGKARVRQRFEPDRGDAVESTDSGNPVDVPFDVGSRREDRAIILPRQSRALLGCHLGRLKDRPVNGAHQLGPIQQQLRELRGHQVILRVIFQRAFVESLRCLNLTARQRNLVVGGSPPGELAEQFGPVRISGRGPRPVGRGGFPILERLVGASPLREQIDVGRLGRDAVAVDFHGAGSVFVLVLNEQVADLARQLWATLDQLVDGLPVPLELIRRSQFLPGIGDPVCREALLFTFEDGEVA